MATKRKRGNVYEYTIRRSALLPKPVYLTFDTMEEGDEYTRRLEALLDRGIVPDELLARSETSPLLRDHVRRYVSTQHVKESDRKILALVVARQPAKLEVRDLTFAWATAWVTSMKREYNLAPSTIRHHVGALARCLDWLAAHGDLHFNPLRTLPRGYATYTPDDGEAVQREGMAAKQDDERDRRLQPGEEEAIRAILAGAKREGKQRALDLPNAEALRVLFDLALESAMRLSEMYTLTRDQIDLDRRTVFLTKTKNGSKRQVPLSSKAGELLRGYLPTVERAQAFPWYAPGDDTKKVTSRLSRQYSRIFAAAECVDLHFHDLRHEATSRFFERTELSDLEIAKITGHKDMRSLMRYANLRGSKLAARLW